jgi:hypothetical protein
MNAFANRILLAFLMAFVLGAAAQQPANQNDAIRGWLSDESCARGRASSGTFTATNPTCAKACVAKGKKIVLIDPARKMIFTIANPSDAKKNVGDYVEIEGRMDLATKTVRIASLKMLSRGVASCDRSTLAN